MVPFTAAYAVSKFGIRGLTQAAAMELAGHGIRVNCVCGPGGSAACVSEAPMSDTMREFQGACWGAVDGPDRCVVMMARWGNRSAGDDGVPRVRRQPRSYNGADFVLDNGAGVGTTLDQMMRGAGPDPDQISAQL